MSTPIQAGSTNQRLRMVAVLNDYSTFKTDLVAADITALAVKRVGAADVTVSVNTDDSNPDDAHTDGNIYNAGGGEYLVSVPDAAVASGATSAKLYGTWTDGGESGFLIGDTHPLVSYDWQSSARSLTTAATTAIRAEIDSNSTQLAAILEDTGTTLPNQITLAQADLDILTGTDGVTLATLQPNYAPAKAGDQMDLVDAPNATAVTAIQNGLATLAKLLNYVRLLARKDAAVATDLATELGEINASTGTGTGAYSNNDALESIRDNASAGDATLAKQEEILTSLGLISGATGPGERQFDWNIQVGGNPAVGVKVWVSTDSPYTVANTIAGPLYTDDSGNAPTMLLNDDTVYYGWRDSSRYNFTNPVQFRYSTANARWELWNGSAYEEWT